MAYCSGICFDNCHGDSRARFHPLEGKRFPSPLPYHLRSRYHLLSTVESSALNLMSYTHSTSSSNFQLIFNNALKAYEKHTKKDLLAHPLAAELQSCDSPTAILTVLQQQVQDLNRSQRSNERLKKFLDPTVHVLYAFSETLREGVSLVRPRTRN